MKDNNFNFLRLYAAIGVLIGHVATHMGIHVLGYDGGGKPFYHLGVPFFFIISGLFVYPSYVRMMERGDSVGHYFVKRFLRLAPSVYFISIITIILFLVVGALTFDIFTEITFWAWAASNVLLMPVYNPDIFSHIGVGVLNGSLWTIFVFASFYLIVPIIYYFHKKFGFKKMLIGMFVISIFFFMINWLRIEVGYQSTLGSLYRFSLLPHLIFFSLGMFWSKYWDSAPKSMTMFISSLILIFIFKGDIFELYNSIGELNELLWMFPLSYAAMWFGYKGFKFFRKFNRMEDLGMGIYIWHMVIINLFLYIGLDEVGWLNNGLMYILVIATTITLAYISRVFIEKPAIKLQNFDSFKKKRALKDMEISKRNL